MKLLFTTIFSYKIQRREEKANCLQVNYNTLDLKKQFKFEGFPQCPVKHTRE